MGRCLLAPTISIAVAAHLRASDRPHWNRSTPVDRDSIKPERLSPIQSSAGNLLAVAIAHREGAGRLPSRHGVRIARSRTSTRRRRIAELCELLPP